MIHTPVLKEEVLKFLDPKPNENFIDCTIGQGGHAKAILEKIKPNGKLLGIDWDLQQIENCKKETEKFRDKIILVNDSYVNLKEIIEREKFFNVGGILLDLGFSSWQLESGKGFSFLKNELLDMRFNLQNELTAEKIVNEWPKEKIEEILKEYGEEKFSKKIAEKIFTERKAKRIKSTFEMAEIVKSAVPQKFHYGKINCATRTFQALRITVNGELESLKKVLPQAIEILDKGGRLAVISFHSLEDRIVKNFFRDKQNEKISKVLTKKPAAAAKQELSENPRARSAKLRAIIKN